MAGHLLTKEEKLTEAATTDPTVPTPAPDPAPEPTPDPTPEPPEMVPTHGDEPIVDDPPKKGDIDPEQVERGRE